MVYEIKSVLEQFPDADSCEYELDVICNYNGELIYRLFDGVSCMHYEYNEHPLAFDTKTLCHLLRFSPERTLEWVIMFGHTLPKHIHQL